MARARWRRRVGAGACAQSKWRIQSHRGICRSEGTCATAKGHSRRWHELEQQLQALAETD
eukprot:2281966-Pleurochrysis_carterae.AAC.2